MAPSTLTDLVEPGTCILTRAGITLESEPLLRKSNVPDNDGNGKECDEVGEAIVGPSSMDMNPYPARHVPTTSVTAMMI